MATQVAALRAARRQEAAQEEPMVILHQPALLQAEVVEDITVLTAGLAAAVAQALV